MQNGNARENGVLRQTGFSYIVLLFAVAVFGIGLGVALPLWSELIRQDREALLIERGNAIVRAVKSYRSILVAGAKRNPGTLEELVEDKRSGRYQHHLRAIPLEPITGSLDWGIVQAADGSIAGVFARSDEAPVRQERPDGVSVAEGANEPVRRYRDWHFLVDAPLQASR